MQNAKSALLISRPHGNLLVYKRIRLDSQPLHIPHITYIISMVRRLISAFFFGEFGLLVQI